MELYARKLEAGNPCPAPRTGSGSTTNGSTRSLRTPDTWPRAARPCPRNSQGFGHLQWGLRPHRKYQKECGWRQGIRCRRQQKALADRARKSYFFIPSLFQNQPRTRTTRDAVAPPVCKSALRRCRYPVSNGQLFNNSQPIGVGAGVRCPGSGVVRVLGCCGAWVLGWIQKTWCSHDASAVVGRRATVLSGRPLSRSVKGAGWQVK